jgi:uncharacterized membrane protein YdjX (TVP38/TMEM64 family)
MDTHIAVQETPIADPPRATRRAGLARVAAIAVVLVALFFVGDDLARYIPQFAEWVEGLGVWGPVVFAAGYAAATVAMVPGSLLTLAAGAIFGLGRGFATVFIGASVGATLAFLVSRYVARTWVEQKLEGHEKFAMVDRAIGDEGLKIAVLLRLSPLFPFNLLNYALGLTRISLRDYVISHLGMLPGTLLYVYYGRLAGAVAEVASGVQTERNAGYYTVLGLGLVATIVVTTIVTRIASRALKGITVDA